MVMKTVAVFGGSGFLGSYIVSDLISRGYKVIIYDILPLKKEFEGLVEYIQDDILNIEKVNSTIKKSQIVYNLAAIAGIEDCIKNPIEAVKYNILGNTIILQACIENNIERFVFSSSLYAYSTSGGMYATTKKASEDLIKDYSKYYNLKYTILQYGTLYGIGASKDNSVYNYLKSALIDKKIKYIGDGSETREYIHVIDAARLGVDILDEKYINKNIIVTGHHPLKVKELFEMIKEILKENIDIEYLSEMSSWKKESHYKVTPYSYIKDLPYKLTSEYYVELGTGILQLLDSIQNENK